MDDILIHSIVDVFELFLIVCLVAFGVYFMHQTPINDVTKVYLESACIEGGFSTTKIQQIKDTLSSDGYDASKIEITITNPNAINIDTSGKYAKRGEIIGLELKYNGTTAIEEIFKKLGSTDTTRNHCKRYGMSEKY